MCGLAPPPPLVMCDDDQEAEAAYQEALTAALCESEEEKRRKEEEEAAYQARLAEAMVLSAAGDCVVPPLAPPSPVKPESGPPVGEMYVWDEVVREWVSAPPV
ncbi:Pre-mRNA-processing factor 39 [Hordeum vulgare]|nr:Pre-mRNA-processing factor 39 [Hordeum vulgare]